MIDLEREKRHIINTIQTNKVNETPFYHLFVENIFSDDFYSILESRCKTYKLQEEHLKERNQDSQEFTNTSMPIMSIYEKDEIFQGIKTIFESKDVKNELLSKFFVNPSSFVNNISIHENEFEVVFTSANKKQDIHTDIPSKYLSFVFYIPLNSFNLTEEDVYKNATILYDTNLNPCYRAKYVKNSVCIFAPHYYSYHGFDTTIERCALVMFYINAHENKNHEKQEGHLNRGKHIHDFKKNILEKLQKKKLIEYETKDILTRTS